MRRTYMDGLIMILDVGIGSAPYHIRNWFGVKGEIIGIDVRREHTPEVICDTQNLPFAPKVFDVVTASEVLEHMYNAVKALSEWRRVLKANGKLYLTVPNGGWFPTLIQLARHKENASINPEHYNSWDCAHLKQIVEHGGFNVIAVSFFTRNNGSQKGFSTKLAYVLSPIAPSIMHSNIMIKAKRTL